MMDTAALMPTWRDLETAARELGVSRRTLQKWVAAGKLTVYGRAGDRKKYVDLDEARLLRELKPLPRPEQEQ